MGKVILADHKDPFVVSGVLADFADNSSIHADMIFPMAIIRSAYDGTAFWKSMDSDWGNFGYTTFLQVQPGVSTADIGRKLIAIQKREAPHINVSLEENAFQLQPLLTVHLQQADGSSPLGQTVAIFLMVAVLILLIASINYINLSTARAMLRAREVGVRKIIGAARVQLFMQFVVETLIFYGMALVLALGLIEVLIPYYNDLAGKHFHFDAAAAGIWKVVAITGAGVLLASAIYPALLLSSFEPLHALKGWVARGIGNVVFRKVLVTAQFVFSVALMIGTGVIARQLAFIRDRDPGFDRSQVFTVPTRLLYGHSRTAAEQLRKEPAIKEVSIANSSLVNIDNSTGGTDWDGKPVNSMFVVHMLGIDERFLPMMKISLAAGDNFSGRQTDSMHFILNETAVRETGIRDPIGKRFKLGNVNGTIIGVVKDFNFASLHTAIGPLVLHYVTAGSLLYVKTGGREAGRAIAAVQTLWGQYNAGMPFEYSFLDQRYESLYRADVRTGSLFRMFAGIAIFLSCLGLFGLATYSAQVRTREIGIRKVLGASAASIVGLLSRDFLRLVCIAVVIASPLAGWGMYRWLQNFVYRVEVGWWVFVMAGAAALGLALLTIGWQAVRAALANPVKALRSE
jgi:putative ABC transport system permease protein